MRDWPKEKKDLVVERSEEQNYLDLEAHFVTLWKKFPQLQSLAMN